MIKNGDLKIFLVEAFDYNLGVKDKRSSQATFFLSKSGSRLLKYASVLCFSIGIVKIDKNQYFPLRDRFFKRIEGDHVISRFTTC